jgi:uncharacterized LabA/DUF88 family protein
MTTQLPLAKPIAVLIDAENVQLSILSEVLAKCAELGQVVLKRAYGDFTLPNLKDWPKVASELSIHPIQQFRIINGKSASDSALIIDAMDLLHGARYGAFCIVSSDSDFTRLATRIREGGLSVYGFGEGKTHQAFVSACNGFFDTQKLSAKANVEAAKQDSGPSKAIPSKEVLDHISSIIEAAGGKEQKVLLTNFGQQVKKEFPQFKLKEYGYRQWKIFLPAFSERFEFSEKDGKAYVKLP